ncbi:diguanylate cyclase [Rhodanobacter thiooxydans]|uniref:diguanylate cyclase n=2 Tax=Rhodanobacter TaxID=75309 RepID=A0A154QJU6_9GAMM|nr:MULTISPECIES: GGDEF domain-containing protein [Rhodanobacter]AGG89543.1 diguanylate cyclase (GGDEF) domain-containing protein [Rhodanobacter denitrificans]KZC24115.1 diguanylate cyclase [Rhodanobacter thiooxydans]UJM88421.1 GGDEF domain-containing protein [Rhodanobacter denitrificans]
MVIAGWILLGLSGSIAYAAVLPVVDQSASLLKEADSSRTQNHDRFLELLQRLDKQAAKLSPEQQEYLHYLQAWQAAYVGDYATSDRLADTVLTHSRDSVLRFKTDSFMVNSLAERSRYEDAFRRLNLVLSRLHTVSDPDARALAITVAVLLYEESGQYDLAWNYADQLANETRQPNDWMCKTGYARLAALYKAGKLDGINEKLQQGIDLCQKVGDDLYANGIRLYLARVALQRGHSEKAIMLLRSNYDAVQRSGYSWLLSQVDALLAEAYLGTSQIALSKQSALQVVARSEGNKYSESLSVAERVLYLIAKSQGDLRAALDHHERYMASNNGWLDEVGARALAFQIVQQQLLAKKLQLDTLSKQNQILQLQRNLDKKASETSRLYILLLLTVLAFIGFWAYRVKRSQLRFMRLARRDGLTDIFNRQHFVNEAEQQLQYCRKSGREACLVLIDLDHFKAVNDTYGHAVGDRVLKRAVAACQAHLRSTDIFGRLGGEEFGIVLPDCTLEQVLSRTERIRQALVAVVRGDAAEEICVSASFGVASTRYSGHELRQLLIHADDALYRAKREGRNRVSVSDGRAEPQLNAVAVTAEGVQ